MTAPYPRAQAKRLVRALVAGDVDDLLAAAPPTSGGGSGSLLDGMGLTMTAAGADMGSSPGGGMSNGGGGSYGSWGSISWRYTNQGRSPAVSIARPRPCCQTYSALSAAALRSIGSPSVRDGVERAMAAARREGLSEVLMRLKRAVVEDDANDEHRATLDRMGAAAASGAAACSNFGPCADDGDCTDGFSCVTLDLGREGECVPDGGDCTTSSECPDNQVCASSAAGDPPTCQGVGLPI